MGRLQSPYKQTPIFYQIGLFVVFQFINIFCILKNDCFLHILYNNLHCLD